MIGVFDSGIGGLTVVRALLERLPGHAITYLGDTARTPYGSKSADTIIRYSINNIEFLIRKGARLIVIACNTASSYAFEAVRNRFKIPIFEVIGPGAHLAVQYSRRLRIGVIGTRATVASGVYEGHVRRINPGAKVFAVSCPLLVPLVEEGWISKPETAMIVRKYMHPLKTKQIDTLILGCTHYPVLRGVIQRKIGARVVLVDSAQAIAERVGDFLKAPGSNPAPIPQGQLTIFVTDIAEQFRKTAHLILGQPLPIHQADL
ncbi:MAG: glutamate racemase [Desulfobacteraceae bacterium]|nr:MAG: glutamate racemase [Desulfobacteraceae bacterium]